MRKLTGVSILAFGLGGHVQNRNSRILRIGGVKSELAILENLRILRNIDIGPIVNYEEILEFHGMKISPSLLNNLRKFNGYCLW